MNLELSIERTARFHNCQCFNAICLTCSTAPTLAAISPNRRKAAARRNDDSCNDILYFPFKMHTRKANHSCKNEFLAWHSSLGSQVSMPSMHSDRRVCLTLSKQGLTLRS